MRVRHPYALEEDAPAVDGAVHIGGRRDVHAVDADGVIDVADSVPESAVESWAEGYGYTVEELRVEVADTCQVVKADGEVCGRELPCAYHTED